MGFDNKVEGMRERGLKSREILTTMYNRSPGFAEFSGGEMTEFRQEQEMGQGSGNIISGGYSILNTQYIIVEATDRPHSYIFTAMMTGFSKAQEDRPHSYILKAMVTGF